MNDVSETRELLERNSCCIIIPTFNNASTLIQVIRDVQVFSKDVIVVNDGSTDATAGLLKTTEGVNCIDYGQNRGKGFALKTGFSYALQKGYRNAITLDSDGQHFARDIAQFIRKTDDAQPAIIIGARKMAQMNKPAKNTFANRFANFWFYLQTGAKITDTQSGYRLYPIDKLKDIKLITSRYEFELEILVRAFWKGIHIVSVPIDVYYGDKEERVSHFRPFIDFVRISILNTILTLIAVFYYWPIRIVKRLFYRY